MAPVDVISAALGGNIDFAFIGDGLLTKSVGNCSRSRFVGLTETRKMPNTCAVNIVCLELETPEINAWMPCCRVAVLPF